MPLLAKLPGWLRALTACAALGVSLAGQSYSARLFTEPDGLPHQSTFAITQGSDGLMWFSTNEGLGTFDGADWGRDSSPFGDRRQLVACDTQGTLWAISCRPPYICSRRVDDEWQLWSEATTGPGDGTLTHIAIVLHDDRPHLFCRTSRDHLLLMNGREWSVSTQVTNIHDVVAIGESCLIAHQRGVTEIAVAEGGELRPLKNAPDREVLALANDTQHDAIWLIGRNWVGALASGELQIHADGLPSLAMQNSPRFTALADEYGGVLFGERNGVFHYSPKEGLERIGPRSGLDQVGLVRLFRDREGLIWGGGLRGVAKFTGRHIANRTSVHGLPEDEVASIVQLADGRIALGHNAAITILDGTVRTRSLGDSINHTRVMSLAQAGDGSIIAAANHRGLLRIDPDTLDIEEIPRPAGAALDAVQFVASHEDGRVLVGGWKHAFWLRGDEFEPLEVDLPQTGSYIRHVCIDGDAALLTVPNTGVVRITESGSTTYCSENRDLNNVTCSSPRSYGTIWVGSNRGLLTTTKDGGLEPLKLGGDYIRRPVYFIVDDEQGNTWFGTNDGVMIWGNGRMRRLTVEDGLAGRETNRGAGICDDLGRLWLGFDRGVSTYYPERVNAPRHGPTVTFLDPLVDGMLAANWQDLEDHKSLTFRLQSISSRDGDRLAHSFRLEGLEEEWSPWRPLPERTIDYASLPAGDYRLHVRVHDSAGLRGSATTPWIHVMPPWWRSWWFFTALIVTLSVLTWTVTAFAAQRRHARGLELAIDERTSDLRGERNRLRATLTSIADGVIGLDDDGRIVVWNPAATSLTGWTEQQAGGQLLAQVLPTLDLTSTSQNQAIAVETRDGQQRWFEFTVARLSAQATSGHVIAFRDVTERRLEERILTRTERLESLGVLAGGIAHDFNNLLTVMLGNLSLLQLDERPDAAEPRKQMQDAVMNARDLTQQLLTFSKGGAPVRQLASLSNVVSDSVRLALSGANVSSDVEFADDLHPAEIDNGQISQVIHNLVLNARQAMPAGGRLTLRAYNADRTPKGDVGDYAVIEIRDEGTGIAPGELEHIFDPYYSTKPSGTGLGLATSHSIVKRHDGLITVESELGVGSTFRVYLPAASAQPHLQSGDAPQASNTPLRSCHVLCMDDDLGIQLFLKKSLESLGHRCTVVGDGRDALVAYRRAVSESDVYDLVILDMTVPGGMGGIETIEQLRAINPNVVAIAATGYSTEPVLTRFRDHGFHASLSKPFGIDEIDKVLKRVVDDQANTG